MGKISAGQIGNKEEELPDEIMMISVISSCYISTLLIVLP